MLLTYKSSLTDVNGNLLGRVMKIEMVAEVDNPHWKARYTQIRADENGHTIVEQMMNAAWMIEDIFEARIKEVELVDKGGESTGLNILLIETPTLLETQKVKLDS